MNPTALETTSARARKLRIILFIVIASVKYDIIFKRNNVMNVKEFILSDIVSQTKASASASNKRASESYLISRVGCGGGMVVVATRVFEMTQKLEGSRCKSLGVLAEIMFSVLLLLIQVKSSFVLSF